MATRLLFDENISFRVIAKLGDLFPQSEHVLRAGLANGTDREVRNYAMARGLTIVTFDSDFVDLAAVFGIPPKVIWLRCGNVSAAEVERLLRHHAESIESFLADAATACLEVHPLPR